MNAPVIMNIYDATHAECDITMTFSLCARPYNIHKIETSPKKIHDVRAIDEASFSI